MQSNPLSIILRHRRENLKKCSLQPLVGREDLRFFSYPLSSPLVLSPTTIVLSLEAPPLSLEDAQSDLLIIDATWVLAAKMEKGLSPLLSTLEQRSLPSSIRTAYPRRQTGCSDPERGLASLEALYVAYKILGRKCDGLLDHYHWKEEFLRNLEQQEVYR